VRTIYFLLLLFAATSVHTQNVIHLSDGMQPPPTSIVELDWMAGSWTCDIGDGKAEEIWLPAAGHAMMGAFRMYDESGVMFMEIMTIRPYGASLAMQLKHFDDDLTGWEEKDETVDFVLIYHEPGRAYFDGLTYLLRDENTLDVYVAVEEGDEGVVEMHFPFKRTSK
jgi:hypothetical protein